MRREPGKEWGRKGEGWEETRGRKGRGGKEKRGPRV